MANVREIARRITTVRSLAQVTQAMQMVSASRMRRAQERALAARPYADKTGELLRHLAAAETGYDRNALLEARPVRRAAMVVIASDRGLCGSYNTNVIRTALRFGWDLGVPMIYVAVGAESRRGILAAGGELAAEFEGIPSELTVGYASPIARLLESSFLSGEVDAALVAYTGFEGLLRQVPRVVQVLPILPDRADSGASAGAEARTEHGPMQYIYEPSAEGILDWLLPHALEVQIFGYLTESAASEHSARMVAMRNATKAAHDQSEALTRAYNRARQAAITNEILDIASATEAMHGR